eukprot:scaffold130200_cov36-Tisochrysis_lutea.AAC.1
MLVPQLQSRAKTSVVIAKTDAHCRLYASPALWVLHTTRGESAIEVHPFSVAVRFQDPRKRSCGQICTMTDTLSVIDA